MLQSCHNAHVEPLSSLADGGIDHTIFGWILGEEMLFLCDWFRKRNSDFALARMKTFLKNTENFSYVVRPGCIFLLPFLTFLTHWTINRAEMRIIHEVRAAVRPAKAFWRNRFEHQLTAERGNAGHRNLYPWLGFGSQQLNLAAGRAFRHLQQHIRRSGLNVSLLSTLLDCEDFAFTKSVCSRICCIIVGPVHITASLRTNHQTKKLMFALK